MRGKLDRLEENYGTMNVRVAAIERILFGAYQVEGLQTVETLLWMYRRRMFLRV